MDYLMLPPEINSLRIYSGPGATPLVQAAVAWETLAAELSTTSESFDQVVDGLSTTWLGPSSLAMIAASKQYTGHLNATAALAGQTAQQAWAAVAAYEAAFMATVPPPVVAENRIQLATLVATNFLGINTAAIMATEAQYMEMWAQDVAAMIGYQEAAAQATALTPFTPLISSVHPVSVTPAVVGLGGGILSPGSDSATTGLAGVLNLLSGSTHSSLGTFLNSTFNNSLFSSGFYFAGPEGAVQSMMSLFGIDSLANLGNGQQQTPEEPSGGSGTYPIGPGTAPSSLKSALAPSAAMGQAQPVGGLSTPGSWPKPAPLSMATALPETPIMNDAMGMPMMPMISGNVNPTVARDRSRYVATPHKIITRHPSGG